MPLPKTFRLIFLSAIALLGIAGCATTSTETLPAFDKARAFDLLKQQVDFGPRYPGVPGHDKMVTFMKTELGKYAEGVQAQEFRQKALGKELTMHNVVGYINPTAKKWVLLAAHWDSRPMADQEINRQKKLKPIPAANDGASGVAVLLELAKVFSQRKPDIGVFIVLFDGEDYGPGDDAMYLGARYFAANLGKCAVVNSKPVKFSYGILLDMIGDRDLNIYEEAISKKTSPDIVRKVWSAAGKLGYQDKFIPQVKFTINDDHIPLIQAGVKCIDVIDFDYGPWHTLDDTVDKCSPESLKIVGDVVAKVVYEEPGS